MPIEMNQSSDGISAFLNQNSVGVLATADSSGKPHAAAVYFTHDKQLNIYFVTKKDTKKSHNLQVNPHAAIAIFDAEAQATVQAEGTVTEVADENQVEWIFNDIQKAAIRTSRNATPPTAQLIAGGYVVYKITAPVLRKATYSPPDPTASFSNIFEVVHTQPLP